MKDLDIYSQFVKIELPNFKLLLEKGIIRDEIIGLNTENYIRLFLKNYLDNDSFTYFSKNLILSEDLLFTFFTSKFECKIVLKLSLDLNYQKSAYFLSEDYQIVMSLIFNKKNDDKISETLKISRNEEGFYKMHHEIENFQTFEKKINQILENRKIINTIPDAVKFEYNIDY